MTEHSEKTPLDIQCPTCLAKAGERCGDWIIGKFDYTYHNERIAAAKAAHTASHYESASAAKEDADAFDAAERPEQTTRRFNIIWDSRRAAYYVSIHSYNGGEVVDAASYDALKLSHAALVGHLETSQRALEFLREVNMQSRDDSRKLRELAECRIEAIRVLPSIKTALANAKKLTEGI